jgi:hypothetical protein
MGQFNFLVINRFLAQTFGRLANVHPINLLEMKTLLHALCCFAIYAAWWHKPLDIAEPSLLDLSSIEQRQLAAWMLMDSESTMAQFHCDKYYITVWGSRKSSPGLVGDIPIDSDLRRSRLDYAIEVRSQRRHPPSIHPSECCMHPTRGTLRLYFGQEVFGYRLCNGDRASDEGYFEMNPEDIVSQISLCVPPAKRPLWTLAPHRNQRRIPDTLCAVLHLDLWDIC